MPGFGKPRGPRIDGPDDLTGRLVSDKEYKSWMCVVCGWIYHEEEGSPDDGIPPGTKWEDVPEGWVCPDCGAGKEDFEMVEL